MRLTEAQILKIIGSHFNTCTDGEKDGRVYFSSKFDKRTDLDAYKEAMTQAIDKLNASGFYAQLLDWQATANAVVRGLKEPWFVFLWFAGSGYSIELRRCNATGGYDQSDLVQRGISNYREAKALAISQIDQGKANYLVDYSMR